MSFSTTRLRRALLASVIALTGVTATSDAPRAAGAAQAFELEWEQPEPAPAYFELCVNGGCQPLFAQQTGGTTWRAPLPFLPLGEHRLLLRACGTSTCVAGTPELFVRVVRPNPKTPPILVR